MTSPDRSFEFTADRKPLGATVQPGCGSACICIPDVSYRAVVSSICERVDSISDDEIRVQVVGFCNALSEGLSRLPPGINVGPMFADIDEEESYFEWMFDDLRFGFSFKHDPADSYWFLVSLEQDGNSTRFTRDFRAGYVQTVEHVLNHLQRNA